jgi:hypothetical protein
MIIIRKGGQGSGYKGHPGGHYVGGKLERGGSRPSEDPNKQLQIKMRRSREWDEQDKADAAGGISQTARVKIADDGSAIIKIPLDPESHTYDNPANYSSSLDPWKEEDTYKLAKELGFDDIVPVAIRAKDAKGILKKNSDVSVQQWIDDAKVVDYVSRLDFNDVDYEKFEQIAWLDVAIGNYDRHSNNLLVKIINNKAVPYAIDNGISFDINRIYDEGVDTFTKVMGHMRDTVNVSQNRDVRTSGYIRSYQASRKYYDTIHKYFTGKSKFKQQLVDRYGAGWLLRAADRLEEVKTYIDGDHGFTWID